MPALSIIIPCRNESRFIAACLDSVLANDFPRDWLEVLVVDGMSDDGTRAIVGAYAAAHQFVKMVDNPARVTPTALNIGIARSRGTIVMRLDAHATYPPGYIRQCIAAMRDYGADRVGGACDIVPRDDGPLARAIAAALGHPFGVGNAHYRIGVDFRPRWVDSVPFFCCRRELFGKVGLFNEQLVRGQDMEFSCRLLRAGVRTLLVPSIRSTYYARADLRSFLSHAWGNGVWAVLPFAFSRATPVRCRHLVPGTFVGVVCALASLALLFPAVWRVLLALVGAYVGAALGAACQIAWRRRDPRYAFTMPLVFSLLHASYGFGSLWGLCRLALHRGLRRVSRRSAARGGEASCE